MPQRNQKNDPMLPLMYVWKQQQQRQQKKQYFFGRICWMC